MIDQLTDQRVILRAAAGSPGSSLLETLSESGVAERTSDPEQYELTHDAVSSLDDLEAHVLGLPDAIGFTLRLRSTGAVVRPETELTIDWFDSGIQTYLVQRIGAIAEFEGGVRYRLPSPFFELLYAVDRFNTEQGSPNEALRLWGDVREWLPDDAVLDEDQHLAQVTVDVASAFSIRPTLDVHGEPDFEVIPGRLVSPQHEGSVGDAREFNPVLPRAREEAFKDRFGQLQARSAYPVGAGSYLVVTPEVERVFAELKAIKNEGPRAVRQFVRQPHAVLKDRLEGTLDGSEVDDVFADYGERVVGVGLWQPKVVPWIKKASEPWLPPEQLGIIIDGKSVEINKSDVAGLTREIERALEKGEPSVAYNGVDIPATTDVLEMMKNLESVVQPGGEGGKTGTREPRARTVLQVEDNLESAEFVKPKRAVARPEDVNITKHLNSDLYSHQQEGFDWLCEAWTAGEPGVLLADDMGLGKTLQALAFMAWLRALEDSGQLVRAPMLLVAPTGLLRNWTAEHDIHLSGSGLGQRVEAFGSGLKRLKTGSADTETGEIGLDLSKVSKADWVLTSYETYRDYQLSFGKVHWQLAVFDEVQKVKNPAAGVTDAAKSVDAEFVLTLTGTPVENRLADLWSVVDLAQPGLLGSLKAFSSEWESEDSDLSGLREMLSEGEAPVMMRRLKEDHLDGLPMRRTVYARSRMPDIQANAYDEAIALAREGGQGATLQALGRIRSVSLHPHARGTESLDEYVARSARLKLAVDWLKEIQSRGEKALVFAESRAMQATLAEIAQHILGLTSRPLLINGQVAGPKRQERVDRFQSGADGFDMMILSPKAGGVGLTLTAANHVIHLSRWWNPAVEDQCTDRVYRIGQKREVFVYHPIAEHPDHEEMSFDVRLDDLLRRKRRLSRTVLAPPGASDEDFRQLYTDVTGTGERVRAVLNLDDVDVLDGVGFERWVGRQLKAVGYQVSNTPWSGDGGVDLLASAADRPTLLIQCKHTQTDATLQRAAIEEVVRGIARYPDANNVLAMVVTNGASVAPAAERLARREGVQLWTREHLRDLSDPRLFLGPLR